MGKAKVITIKKGEECCANCKYQKVSKNVLELLCVRFPPQGSRPSLFPIVQSGWFCGEWKAKV